MSDAAPDFAARREALAAIAERAGEIILRHYREGCAVEDKSDGSPVTAADREADAAIAAGLAALDPAIPIVSEESVGAREPAAFGPRFWLVDPLDGTREFVAGTGDFCVNIALVENGYPTFGLLYLPVEERFYAGGEGAGAWERVGAEPWRRIEAARLNGTAGVRILNSPRTGKGEKTRAFLNGLTVASLSNRGSALKFGVLAAGGADLYTRFGPTGEWDTAAGQAVLEAAGGSVSTVDGARLSYGKPGFLNPSFIAMGGCRNLFWRA
jgi:3'(2'),5'-bisphosphate nucleotidase